MSRPERAVGEGGPGTTRAADAITVEHAEASRDSGRWDDPLPAKRPINMNHAGTSSIDDSGVLRQDTASVSCLIQSESGVADLSH